MDEPNIPRKSSCNSYFLNMLLYLNFVKRLHCINLISQFYLHMLSIRIFFWNVVLIFADWHWNIISSRHFFLD